MLLLAFLFAFPFDNKIGCEGAKLIATGLLRNSFLKNLYLSSLLEALFFLFLSYFRYDPFLPHTDNDLKDEGVAYLSQALKNNKKVEILDITG